MPCHRLRDRPKRTLDANSRTYTLAYSERNTEQMIKTDNSGECAIVMSGRCPFCNDPVHMLVKRTDYDKAVIVDNEGTRVQLDYAAMAHRVPSCVKFKRAAKARPEWLMKRCKMREPDEPETETPPPFLISDTIKPS